MTLKKLFAGAVLASLAIAGSAGVASAHGKHRHFHHHSKKLVIVVGKPHRHSSSCDYYYWKWKNTGSFAWKSAYMECIGAW